MPSDRDKFARYRASKRAAGLKQVRLWVPDPSAPGFAAEMRRQAALLRKTPEERETMDLIAAVAAWPADDE